MALAYQESQDVQAQKAYDDNLLDSAEYLSAQGKIMIPMGMTEQGDMLIRDLSSIPHILVCGFTGTGKTAFVQTIMSVMLSKQSPSDIKLIIYDSKRIEYGLFANTPHLFVPVIYDRDKAIAMLKFLAEESLKRFRLFAEAQCKDYEKYNSLQTDDTKKLPEIFFVMDDFSSLSLDKNDMYEFLNVLKNGRIAGIHLIVISSMASTKVLQKELISNIPCRICFRLSSKTESRNILEQSGAEELFVPGEMIYKFQNDSCKCQCAYATYENIDAVMKSVSQAVASVTALGIEASMIFSDISTPTGTPAGISDTDYDELLADAAEAVIDSQRASIGLIQRRFRIGFNRAARIMDQLQSLGVVSEEYGTAPRNVLMTVAEWNGMCSTKGLKQIKHSASQTRSIPNPMGVHSSYTAKSFTSDADKEEDAEPEIKLRDFAEFTIDKTSISIHDHEIHFTKPIMTRLGPGTITPTFSGKNVTGLIYKKPSMFSKGYMTFEFDPRTNIKNENPYLLQADISNISEIIKIEFNSDQDRMIRLFLQQLSEDIGIPIKRV